MSRACLLPMPGDPIILNNFIKNFNAVWKDEVDTLYVLLNVDHRMPREIVDWDMELLEKTDKVIGLYTGEMLFQGAALRHMLPYVKEDLILSIEDDTIITKRGQVDKCFRKIESGEADVVGSPRSCCSKQILDACATKWDLDYSGYGDKGPVYWPNFFFCRKEDLLKTDQHYEPIGWKKGDYIKELDITAEEDLTGDVFVWLCIQLRALGLKFYDVPQYHSRPSDLEDMAQGLNLGDNNLCWIHIGSLTMTAEDLLIQAHDPKEHVNMPKSDVEKQELERRYAWLILFTERALGVVPQDMVTSYVNKINEYIRAFSLRVKNVSDYKKAYERYISW